MAMYRNSLGQRWKFCTNDMSHPSIYNRLQHIFQIRIMGKVRMKQKQCYRDQAIWNSLNALDQCFSTILTPGTKACCLTKLSWTAWEKKKWTGLHWYFLLFFLARLFFFVLLHVRHYLLAYQHRAITSVLFVKIKSSSIRALEQFG